MTGTTYGDLMAIARTHTDQGVSAVRAYPFADRDQALAALTARLTLLDAVAGHVDAIVGPARRTGASRGTDMTERAALALGQSLRELARTTQPRHPPTSGSPWPGAARALRAATDLLAVHHDSLDRPRSPDASTWTSRDERDAALAALGRLATTAITVEDSLALRAGHAGLPWSQVRAALPDTTDALEWALTLASSTQAPLRPGFTALGLIGEPIRSDTAPHELTDRMSRVRQLTWELTRRPDGSTATLRDLASLATIVYAHTAAHRAHHGLATTRTVDVLTSRARAWQRAAHDLGVYLSPAPGNADIRTHTRATAHLLARAAPLRAAAAPVGEQRALTEALRSAVATTDKVQDWAAHVFANLADRTDLHVRGGDLSGDAITDDVRLIEAKLTGRIAAAPRCMVLDTIERYRAALPPGSSLTPRAGVSIIEPVLEPMLLERRTG